MSLSSFRDRSWQVGRDRQSGGALLPSPPLRCPSHQLSLWEISRLERAIDIPALAPFHRVWPSLTFREKLRCQLFSHHVVTAWSRSQSTIRISWTNSYKSKLRISGHYTSTRRSVTRGPIVRGIVRRRGGCRHPGRCRIDGARPDVACDVWPRVSPCIPPLHFPA